MFRVKNLQQNTLIKNLAGIKNLTLDTLYPIIFGKRKQLYFQ